MKYQLIEQYILNLIAEGSLKSSDKLPSIRSMAKKFSCNKDTVIKGYSLLVENHIAYVIPKSGYYVVDNYKINTEYSNSIIDFKSTLPYKKLLPYKEFSHCINTAINHYKYDLFTYGKVEGLLELRETLAKILWQQNIFTHQDNIYITTGIQQAISIICSINLCDNYSVIVEQPSYSLMQRLIEQNCNNVCGIKRDKNGIDLEELESLFALKTTKFFYTIPRLHNPLGTSLSEHDKEQIATLASRYSVYVIEDDYLGDLVPSLSNRTIYSYDRGNWVIYLKSFSKSFMPGIRIGAAILPKRLQVEFSRIKKYRDINTSVLAQGGLNIYLKSGMYNKHLTKIRNEYQKKMKIANVCLNSQKTEYFEYISNKTGFFIYLTLNNKVNAEKLRMRLLSKNIIVSSARDFYLYQKSLSNSLRLCISALSLEDIKKGIFCILEEISDMSSFI